MPEGLSISSEDPEALTASSDVPCDPEMPGLRGRGLRTAFLGAAPLRARGESSGSFSFSVKGLSLPCFPIRKCPPRELRTGWRTPCLSQSQEAGKQLQPNRRACYRRTQRRMPWSLQNRCPDTSRHLRGLTPLDPAFLCRGPAALFSINLVLPQRLCSSDLSKEMSLLPSPAKAFVYFLRFVLQSILPLHTRYY